MKLKLILRATAVLLIFIVIAGAVWWMSRPQVVQLDENTKLTLLGVDYGRHHKFPKTKTTGRRFRGGPSSFNTTNDTLVVYVLQETKGQNRFGWQAMVWDRDKTGFVTSWAQNWKQAGANKQIAAIQLDAFPRWDSKFLMRFTSWGPHGQYISKKQFVISNPAREKTFSRWTPELMPDTQSDDDLTVTLTEFKYGAPFNHGPKISPDDPTSKGIFVAFHTEQNGVTVTNWQPIRIETSDAAGNHAFNRSWSSHRDENGDATMTYQSGLWPKLMPWKLRVEFSRNSGFKDNEVWTIPNVPVKRGTWQDVYGGNYGGRNAHTNSAVAETTLNGIYLQIFPVIQLTDQGGNNGEKPGGFRIQADQPFDGMQMTLLKATDENGRAVPFWSGNSWGNNNSHQFQLRNLRNATSLNLTIALHKSQFVEFIAKPEKASGNEY